MVDTDLAKCVVALAIIVGLCAFVVNGAYVSYIVSLQYEREIGQYFDYADSASDAKTKSIYFGQYINALKEHGLDKGTNSVYNKEQPAADLSKKFTVATSLQNRIVELSTLDETDTAYQLGMTQINDNEFCWFPNNAFYQKFALEHGAWGDALFPSSPYNRCD